MRKLLNYKIKSVTVAWWLIAVACYAGLCYSAYTFKF